MEITDDCGNFVYFKTILTTASDKPFSAIQFQKSENKMAASMNAVLVLVHSNMVDEEGTPRCRWNVFFRCMSLVAKTFCLPFWLLNTKTLAHGQFFNFMFMSGKFLSSM